MTAQAPSSRKKTTMRRRLIACLATLALVGVTTGSAVADPDNTKTGTPPVGYTDAQIWAGVGADADAELVANAARSFNAQSPSPANYLASYDAFDPVTGATTTITTKPGCDLIRPNGANAGMTAIKANQKSFAGPGDGVSYCIDWVRSSRAKNITGETAYDFYALTADAVTWASVGHSYAPTTLTIAQLKKVFTCEVTDWSEVGGQKGAIHVYAPSSGAATYTFFLQVLGITINDVAAGCGLGTTLVQQNDGRELHGDPQGITPYAVTKWAAQKNHPAGISDVRAGTVLGHIDGDVPPTIVTTFAGKKYTILNPAFGSGPAGRILYDVTRTNAPPELKALFQPSGFFCAHPEFLYPFGASPLGADTTAAHWCGQLS
ncbi:MAG: hypothetical protein QOI42_1241 [Frankiaceae bacterium]|nr:hypothetical protein [Frankiaceae bacterium]